MVNVCIKITSHATFYKVRGYMFFFEKFELQYICEYIYMYTTANRIILKI